MIESSIFPTITHSSTNAQGKQETVQTTLLDNIRFIIDSFLQKKGEPLISYCQHLKVQNVHFYGIHKQFQHLQLPQDTRKAYQVMKGHILTMIDKPQETKVLQIVGDSSPFSAEGTKEAKAIMKEAVQGQHLLLYGYTGTKEKDGRACVNAALSDVLEEEKCLERAIGNVVGFHTPVALSKYGCTGPNLEHYMVVYSDDDSEKEKGAVFGDDVIASDYFADELMMFEGGAQSFKQAVDALYLKQKITTYTGLREERKLRVTEENLEGFPEGPITTEYFNATTFFKELQQLLKERPHATKEDLQTFFTDYFGPGKHYIVDKKRKDYNTKEKLLHKAWDLFLREELYKRLDLFTHR